MCGILLYYSENLHSRKDEEIHSHKLFQSLVPIIRERGRDYEHHTILENYPIELFSSVLSLRQPLAKQPLHDERFVIQFNGELYNQQIGACSNDVEYFHRLLLENKDIAKSIGRLDGEFAYTVTDKVSNVIYFGKDMIGRKSLCYSLIDGELFVSSCPPWDSEDRQKFVECSNACIYSFDMVNKSISVTKFEDHPDLPISPVVKNNFKEYKETNLIIEQLYERLLNAVRKRVSTIFPLKSPHDTSKLAILFSGGIDCTLLAGFCGEILEENTTVDLLNVSFSNPRAKLSYDETPDRVLAIKNANLLNEVYNKRKVYFNLIKINIPYEEYLAAKERVIKLIYPNDTEMDLSIAIAFYFATSGKNSETQKGDSACRVLLSGLGADELFGGYTRHERIFTGISNQIKRKLKNKPVTDLTDYDLKSLIAELRDELQCDLDRLWERNLTRDDKVISSWNKEVRYPFLDDSFVRWVATEVPINLKLCFNLETGEIIRKRALRKLALKMGLDFVADEPKRAIQFGSKSAKMDIGSGKVKGTDKL